MTLQKLLFSVILFSTLLSAQALSCYQCNSEENAECNDLSIHPPHVTSSFYKHCDDYYHYNDSTVFCRKTKLLVLLPTKHFRTIRSCGWIQHHLPCYRIRNDGHEEINCQCFGEGCNGSNTAKVFSSFIFLVFAAFVLR